MCECEGNFPSLKVISRTIHIFAKLSIVLDFVRNLRYQVIKTNVKKPFSPLLYYYILCSFTLEKQYVWGVKCNRKLSNCEIILN